MFGTPTHRRFEALPETVDIEATISVHDPSAAPYEWPGRDTAVDQQQHEALRD